MLLRNIKRWKGNFIDVRKVKIKGGKGGNGIAHFGREPFKIVAPPDGGNGGKGGSVWIRVCSTSRLRDLSSLRPHFYAGNGANGRSGFGKGADGEDLIIDVPKGSLVIAIPPPLPIPSEFDSDIDDIPQENEDMEISSTLEPSKLRRNKRKKDDVYIDTGHPLMPVGVKFLVAKGGFGGKGNAAFRTSTYRSPEEFTEGNHGEEFSLKIELKSMADIGLVGLPNAGKSSFIRAVSRSRSAIGHWAFTTLHPHLGTVQFPAISSRQLGSPSDGRSTSKVDGIIDIRKQLQSNENGIIRISSDSETSKMPLDESFVNDKEIVYPPFSFNIADIPGIIKGAALENRGLGHEFLRHIEKSKLLVYVIDLSKPEPWNDLKILQDELEAYQEGMTNRRGLVLCNKADIEGTRDNYEKMKDILRSNKMELVVISSKYQMNLEKALWKMREIVQDERKKEDEYIRNEIKKYLSEEGKGNDLEIEDEDGAELIFKDLILGDSKLIRGVHQIVLPSTPLRQLLTPSE